MYYKFGTKEKSFAGNLAVVLGFRYIYLKHSKLWIVPNGKNL